MRMKKQTVRIICAAILVFFVIGLAAGTLFAESAPGTRVVKATLPKEVKAKDKGQAAEKNPLLKNTGNASVSEYMTTGIDSTIQERAAKVWIFGVLGGDREYIADAPALFKTEGAAVREDRAVRFMVLREALYTASSWAVGQARLVSLEKRDNGIEAKLYMADVEPLISQYAKEISENIKTEPAASRILAEWKVSSELKDPGKAGQLRHAETVKQVPVNVYGHLSLEPELIEKLLASPERDAAAAVRAVVKHKLAYAKPYVEEIAFIVRYSSSLEFSGELAEALKKR